MTLSGNRCVSKKPICVKTLAVTLAPNSLIEIEDYTMIVVLAGGVGAARFLQGLVQVVPQERLTVIVNTGDDRDFYGLHVSPDLDIVRQNTPPDDYDAELSEADGVEKGVLSLCGAGKPESQSRGDWRAHAKKAGSKS